MLNIESLLASEMVALGMLNVNLVVFNTFIQEKSVMVLIP